MNHILVFILVFVAGGITITGAAWVVGCFLNWINGYGFRCPLFLALALALLLSLSGMAGAQTRTEDKPKLWVELSVYSDGRIVENRFSTSELCDEAKSYAEFGMSIAEKAAADKAADEAQKKRVAEYEARVAEWRVTHACTEATDDAYEIDSAGMSKKIKALRYHCSLPDGGEAIYDKDGKSVMTWSSFSSSGGGGIGLPARLSKAVCFEEKK